MSATAADARIEQRLDDLEGKVDRLLAIVEQAAAALEPFRALASSGASPMAMLAAFTRGGQ